MLIMDSIGHQVLAKNRMLWLLHLLEVCLLSLMVQLAVLVSLFA